MKSILTLLLALYSIAGAETIHVAQTAAGGDTGADASNAHSLSWLNTAGNWGGGAGEVDPGDTVILNGTFTSRLTVQASGTVGNVITIQFASGAKFSATHWNTSGSNDANADNYAGAAIYATGKSYITIDGGADGIIEATANGTAAANQKQCFGVMFYGGTTGSTVKNLTIRNLYVRTASSADSNYFCDSVRMLGVLVNVAVHDCTTSESGSAVVLGYSGTSSGASIYNNTCTSHGSGLIIGSTAVGATMANPLIYNNTITNTLAWSGHPDVHVEAIHAWAVQASSLITGLKIYGNSISGNNGIYSTSMIFVEGYITAPLVYNNLIVHDTYTGGNGDIYLKGADGARVMNNTLTTNVGANAIECADWAGGELRHSHNNIVLGYTNGVYINATLGGGVSSANYNVFYPAGTTFRFGGGSGQSFAAWQGAGYDANGTQGNPTLNGSYAPTALDTVATGNGTNLTAYFSTDKDGTARPASGAWTIGAFEVGGGGATITVTTGSLTTGTLTIGP